MPAKALIIITMVNYPCTHICMKTANIACILKYEPHVYMCCVWLWNYCAKVDDVHEVNRNGIPLHKRKRRQIAVLIVLDVLNHLRSQKECDLWKHVQQQVFHSL